MDWIKTGGRKQVGRKQVGRKLGARARLYPKDGLFCLNTLIGFTARHNEKQWHARGELF